MDKNIEEEKFSLTGSFTKGKEYIDTRIKLLQLRLIEKTSRVFSSLVVDLVKVVFGLFVLFFFSLALGFYLSELLNSNSLGFLATGTIFILFIFIISLLEPKIERKLLDMTIRKFMSKWNDEEEEEEEVLAKKVAENLHKPVNPGNTVNSIPTEEENPRTP